MPAPLLSCGRCARGITAWGHWGLSSGVPCRKMAGPGSYRRQLNVESILKRGFKIEGETGTEACLVSMAVDVVTSTYLGDFIPQ